MPGQISIGGGSELDRRFRGAWAGALARRGLGAARSPDRLEPTAVRICTGGQGWSRRFCRQIGGVDLVRL
jgi:hypothetical protein